MKYLPLLLLLACAKNDEPETDPVDTTTDTLVDTPDTDPPAESCATVVAEVEALPADCTQPADCQLFDVDCGLDCAIAVNQSVDPSQMLDLNTRYNAACPVQPCDCEVPIGTDCVNDVCTVVWPGPTSCRWTSTSTLSGVELTGDPAAICTFSLAEADGTIETGWSLEIFEEHDVTVERVGCAGIDKSGLRFAEYLSDDGTLGGTSLWCPRCDTGLCPADTATYTTTIGSWDSTFAWKPRQWTGPSDFGQPPGALFTAGEYQLVIRASGTLASDGTPWSAELSTIVTLTP